MKPLLPEISFEFSDAGLRSISADLTKTVLIHLFLPKETFDTYRTDDERFECTLNAEVLLSVLKTSKAGETCVIRMESPSSDVLWIHFTNNHTGKVRKCSVGVLEYVEKASLPPKNEFSSISKLDANEFHDEVANFSFCDVVNIRTTIAGIVLFGKSDNTRSMEVTFPPSDDAFNSSVVIEVRKQTELDFSRKFLELFTKVTGISEMVELKVSDFLVLKYPVGDGGYLKFYMAPRIDVDD